MIFTGAAIDVSGICAGEPYFGPPPVPTKSNQHHPAAHRGVCSEVLTRLVQQADPSNISLRRISTIVCAFICRGVMRIDAELDYAKW